MRRKLLWVALLYFAEGMPFGLVLDNFPVYFRVHGVSLAAIGFLSLLRAPWWAKVFWSPLVDQVGERRQWIAAALATMAGALLLVQELPPAPVGTALIVTLFAFTIAAATQDVAIDAYTIELLVPGEEGVANGVRVSATVGVAASVAGALVGGVVTSRSGIFRSLWLLGLLQAVSNLGYATAAWTGAGRPGIYAASLAESFTGGLGTAAFLAFLMNVCDKQQAATQYALLSALFNLSGSLAGALSGVGASRLGYGAYFALTFVLALPAYALLPWVRGWIREAARPGDEPERRAASSSS